MECYSRKNEEKMIDFSKKADDLMERFMFMTNSVGTQIQGMNSSIVKLHETNEKMKEEGENNFNKIDERFKDMEKRMMDLDMNHKNRSDDERNGNVTANQGETVIAGLHKETTESEVVDTLKEMIKEIGMDHEKVKLVCPAKPITHAFVYFENDSESNKFIRSANMLKKELKGRKIRITRSMEAEERFYNKRIGYVKNCINKKHGVPLHSISLNWNTKHVTIKGQIVAKTCQDGSLKFSKYQDVEDEVDELMQKWQTKKLVVTTVSSREKGIRRREEGETTCSLKKFAAQGIQDECKKNHLKPDARSPTQRRNCNNDIDNEAKGSEDMRSKGGGRLKHSTVDGDVPMCLRRKLEDIKDPSSSKSKKNEGKESGSGIREKMKNCVTNNMASGSKELQLQCKTTGKDMQSKNREVTFIILQKNMRSMHSSEKIEELVTELEGYRWDAILLSETWRHEPAEIWETHHNHIFMGAGKYENKHGVGIMLNRRWRKRIVDTNYISERAIKATIMVNRRRIDLMSVYFPHSKYADHHVEKMYKTIEKHMPNDKKCIPIIGGDFNAELGPGSGSECKSVGKHTLNESNKRGDWMKSWLMINDYSALNTMFRKTPQKQTSFVSPKGKEKQIDYILTKRRYLRNVKDAEANDMIHMGSDHRCVMATFLIDIPERKNNERRGNKKRETTVIAEREDEAKEINGENSELEKRYQEIIVTIKKSRRRKKKRSTRHKN